MVCQLVGDWRILAKLSRRTSQNNFESALGQLKRSGFHEKLHTHRAHDLCMLDCDLSDDVAIQLVVRDSKWQCFLQFRIV